MHQDRHHRAYQGMLQSDTSAGCARRGAGRDGSLVRGFLARHGVGGEKSCLGTLYGARSPNSATDIRS